MGNIKKIKSVNNLLSAMRLNGDPVKTTKDGTDEYIIGGDYKKKTDGSKFIGESTSKIKKDTKGVKYVSMLGYGENLPKGDTIHLRNISALKSNGNPLVPSAEREKEIAKKLKETEAKKRKEIAAKKATEKRKKIEEEKVETKGPAKTPVDNKTETMGNQRLKEAVDRANSDDSLLTGKEKRKFDRSQKKQAEKDRVLGLSDEELAAEKELKSAKCKKLPVFKRGEMLANIVALKKNIVISGSHGKTTTTSLVANILLEAGLDPTVINGGVINSLKNIAKLGKGEWAVIESDESDGSFLKLP